MTTRLREDSLPTGIAFPSGAANLLGDLGGEARLVARRGVLVDDALGGHLVDERLERLQRRLGALNVLVVERLADRLQAGAELGPEGAVVLATLDVLPVGLEGRLVTLCHCLEPRCQKDAEQISLTRMHGCKSYRGHKGYKPPL